MASAKPPLLWFFTDPMCSWCWGFTPVIEAVREEYLPRLDVELVLAGLHPDETEPISDVERQDIFHEWHQVHERSGQAFDFEHAALPGFICNSEPPCRAVLAAASLDQKLGFQMIKAIQSTFFAHGRDVTETDVLADIAVELGLDRDAFLKAFESDEARSMTQAQFIQTRKMGVRGLPALILQQGDEMHHICNSWQSLVKIRSELDAKLGKPN